MITGIAIHAGQGATFLVPHGQRMHRSRPGMNGPGYLRSVYRLRPNHERNNLEG